MEKTLNLLGLAKRARKVVLGTDTVVANLQGKKLHLMFIATDASSATIDKLDKKAYFYQVKVINKYSTEELSKALGVPQVKVVGVTDLGFAQAMLKEN